MELRKINKSKKVKVQLHRLIIIYCIFISLIVDLLTGVILAYDIPFEVGITYRSTVILISIIYLFKKLQNFKLSYFFIIVIVGLIVTFVWSIAGQGINILQELPFYLRVTYIFALLNILTYFNNRYNISDLLIKNLYWYSFFASICVIFSYLTGIGLNTYGTYAFGSSSFFNAPNDIGIALLITLSYFLFTTRRENFRYSLLQIAVNFIALILLGTTSGMAGAVFIVFIFLVRYLFTKTRTINSLSKKIFISQFLLILVCISVYFFISLISSNIYYQRKYERMISKGPRSVLIEAANKHLQERSLVNHLVGEGHSLFGLNYSSYAIGNKRESKEGAYVENDLYDIFGAYGIIFGSILVIPYVLLLLWGLLSLIRVYKLPFAVAFPILLAILHSFTAGHVMTSPTTQTVLAAVIILGLSYNRQNHVAQKN